MDKENLKKNVQDLEMTIKKQEAERQSKDHQIRSLQDEIAAQDDSIAKANKERKQQEEVRKIRFQVSVIYPIIIKK